ncbi:TMV resistance protein N-like [Cryptomeria japonica]|uniref:TMV resistance protein N-like n=1 Tax=Cryptomeria japonica TaxID=3369 RepID=UPI0027DA77D2|nr:TMV resistance protein N-like [Cryptomeria japonica]
MASTSITGGPPERESPKISPRRSSCFGRVSFFNIPCCSAQSKSRSATSTIPDNEAPASLAVGRLEREPDSSSKAAFDGIAPSASTSASQRTKKPCYDVFINHRGPDVKYTLASTLYTILTGMSLSVFLDSQELEYGDFLPRTIEAAMASASLHIAIFSKTYAESRWCLAELSFMLKSAAKIIPIFYHVDPSDLRCVHQGKGMYVEAFKKHERNGKCSPEQLQEWKTALHNVSFYAGQIVNTKE